MPIFQFIVLWKVNALNMLQSSVFSVIDLRIALCTRYACKQGALQLAIRDAEVELPLGHPIIASCHGLSNLRSVAALRILKLIPLIAGAKYTSPSPQPLSNVSP